MDLRESLGKKVSDYTYTDFVRVSIEESVADASREMKERGSTEALVASRAGVLGIVTERDILYKVVAESLDPRETKVRDIMSAPVMTVEDSETVAAAIAKMSKLGVRRLGVMRRGKFVGIVTQKNMAAGKLGDYVSLPELGEQGSARCPYCGASAKDSRDLSRHIDRDHLGLGLLEGNLTKW